MPITVDSIVNKFKRNGESSGAAPTRAFERELLEVAALSPESAMARFQVLDRGLDPAQVEAQRAQFGLNQGIHRQKLSFLADLLHRCKNPLVIQLFLIAGVSLWMGESPSAVVV